MRAHFNFCTEGKRSLAADVKEKRFRPIITHHIIKYVQSELVERKKINQLLNVLKHSYIISEVS